MKKRKRGKKGEGKKGVPEREPLSKKRRLAISSSLMWETQPCFCVGWVRCLGLVETWQVAKLKKAECDFWENGF